VPSDVASEPGVMGLHRVTPGEGRAMHACLREHWPASVKFIGQIEEEGGDFGQWWTERWPRPRAALYRGRRAFSMFAADEEAAERILDGVDWSREVRFSGLDHRFLPLLKARTNDVSEHPCGMYRLERATFRPFRAADPDTRLVEPLRREDAALVTRHWSYGDGEEYPLSRIEGAPTACVRVEGVPAAWALVHYDGSIGMVHTLEAHRRKGYARAVVSALVEKRFRAERAPYCFIVEGNHVSERLFEDLGFFRQADLSWVHCAPGEQSSDTGEPRCDL